MEPFLAFKESQLKEGSYEDYYTESESNVVSYLEEKYDAKKDLKTSYFFTRNLDVINLNQTALNTYYEQIRGVVETSSNCTPVSITILMDYYDNENTANNDNFNFLSTLISELSVERPIIYSTETHSIVVRGFSQYKITYLETIGRLWWKKIVTRTEYFKAFRSSKGWDSSGYSFLIQDDLNDSIFSSHKFSRGDEN